MDVDLGAMIPQQTLHGWRFRTQYWRRYIRIRTNMTSSAWTDIPSAVAAKDGNIFDNGGAKVPGREFLRMVDELPEDGTNAAAFRWAVVVSEDSLMELQLQSLPGPAVLVAG